MTKRRSRGIDYWVCSTYPVCRKAIEVVGSRDAQVARARAILQHSRVSGNGSAKLLSALEAGQVDRVLPLVLGTTTPGGHPTVQAILQHKLGTRKRRRRGRPKRPDPLDGIELYGPDDVPAEAFTLVEIPEQGGPCAPTTDYPHHEIKFESLNPVQTAVLPWATQGVNMVVAAETSAGKTTVAEMCMGDGLVRGGKVIFLSPLKAVSQEKRDDWTDDDHPWSRLNVSILTGDYVLSESRRRELADADVIVMTSEMLDSKTRRMHAEQNTWLLSVVCLVVDEAHLLTMEGRGDALEAGIMRFTKQNPHARVIFLSATMPNVDALARWLTHLNGKPSVVILSGWRPTTLEVHWPTYWGVGQYHVKEDNKRSAVLAHLEDFPDDRWIVFVHSKKAGRQLLEECRQRPVTRAAEFHSADLNRDARLRLEKRFRQGDLRIVIATSTLAYGVNMPARRVAVLGIHRGLQQVNPIDVKQMVGRAGRVGLDPRGDAYVFIPEDAGRLAERTQEKFENIGEILSVLNQEDTLAFHLTAEVAEGEVTSVASAVAWHERSLACFQGRPISAQFDDDSTGGLTFEIVLNRLAKCGVLKIEDDQITPTMLGRVASWLYFSPFDVANWASNFRRVMELNQLQDDVSLAYALGQVKTGFDSYCPREHQDDLRELAMKLRSRGFEFRSLAPTVLAFESLLTGTNYRALVSAVRGLQRDSSRIMQAIALLDKHVIKGLGDQWCELLAMRVTHGVRWEEASLCQLPQISRVRAGKLLAAGLTSIEEVARRPKAVAKAVGAKTAERAVRRAREIAGVEA